MRETRLYGFVLSVDYEAVVRATETFAAPPSVRLDYSEIDWGWVAMGMSRPSPCRTRKAISHPEAKCEVFIADDALDILEINGVYMDGIEHGEEVRTSIQRFRNFFCLCPIGKQHFRASGAMEMPEGFDSVRKNVYRDGMRPAPGGFLIVTKGDSPKSALGAVIDAVGCAKSRRGAGFVSDSLSVFDEHPFRLELNTESKSFADRVGVSVGMALHRDARLSYIGTRTVDIGNRSRIFLVQ